MPVLTSKVQDWTPQQRNALRARIVDRLQAIYLDDPENPRPTVLDIQAVGSRVRADFNPVTNLTSDLDIVVWVAEPGWHVQHVRRYTNGAVSIRIVVTVKTVPRAEPSGPDDPGEPILDPPFGAGRRERPQGWQLTAVSLMTHTVYPGPDDAAWVGWINRHQEEL